MRHLFITLLVSFMTFGLAVEHADARRFGGGASAGSMSRSAAPAQSAAPRAATPPRQAQAGGASRFMGPLAGVMAGGLLAALFFGGAFDGIRMFDIILVALVAFGIFMFLSRRRAAMASAGGQHGQGRPTHQEAPQAFTSSQAAAGGSFATSTPAWFDKERFLAGAKEHFSTLQKAWDDNDLAQMQDYVTPELYNLLREERAKQPNDNKTEVVRLFAELGNVQEYGRQAEASVLFHGVVRENGQEVEFNETWHLIREMRDGAPWYIQGIEQRQ